LLEVLLNLLLTFYSFHLNLIRDDVPILRAERHKVKPSFDVGLVETREALVSVESFELSVEVLFIVLRVSILMKSFSIVMIGRGESNQHEINTFNLRFL
jgi:hypothetical protein